MSVNIMVASVLVPFKTSSRGLPSRNESTLSETIAPNAPRNARARELYLRGDRLYTEGRYEAAVEAFQESYHLSGRPLLLFNLANAYERLARYEEALAALRDYAPHAPVEEEDQIRARLRSLTRRAEEQHAEEQGGGSSSGGSSSEGGSSGGGSSWSGSSAEAGSSSSCSGSSSPAFPSS